MKIAILTTVTLANINPCTFFGKTLKQRWYKLTLAMVNFISLFHLTILSICTITARGQSNQAGIIDFYGAVPNGIELKKCLPFKENDTLYFLNASDYPKAKKEIMDCLLGQDKIIQADISFVCCDEKEGKWIVFVGVDTIPKIISQNKMTYDIRLPAEIKETYDSLMNLLAEAIEKGEATENYSNGHSLMDYLPARRLQEKFITYSREHISLLKEVLRRSKHSDERAVAATVIAYYPDKTNIIKDLLGAVKDPDEDVRNNAVRAIGIIAGYAQNNPDLNIEIPPDPFIDMINSISWTDRNKSSFVLLALTKNRDQKLLNQLKQQALKSIVDMAKWKSNSHSMPGYMMLGRIAGWPDQEIMEAENSERLRVIEKMLADIGN